ncbi:tetratricopeptide repeat protein [Erythrobacter mangrovi]|uniref:Tetratricopeptide repeat protein n=2 Tax=Erythrobacter mangrovi TaxID=2739433 RepID=A0A7D3Y1Q0_9SPHN|nr:tetratricopeptide repeat protein [Erythrobacter mangrovi]
MRSQSRLFAVLLGTLACGGASATVAETVLSPAAFAALDPTLPGRKACRGFNGSDAVFNARLQLAQAVADSQGFGTGAIGLYSGIATSDLPLSGMDPQARRYFDQGLAFAYGFNHQAAIRSFKRAQEIDPDCAECWWGEAMASGPNINAAMDGKQNRSALAALAEARRLSADANPFVKALIDAQTVRYSDAPDADRGALDRSYAQAMLRISGNYPESDDLAVLAAESAMNTSPWNYWTDEGQPVPFIAEAVGLIEKVMDRNPTHPQASHLYIHLLELPDPKKAEAAADRLRADGPKALAHLVHMPAHIYFRLGRYADSIEANIQAVAADEDYLREVGDDGLVRYGYYPHNVHFLLTSAQAMGDLPTVVNQTAKLERVIDVETGRDLYWVQAIYAAPYFAYAQYASPEATLALTSKAHPLDYVEAMRHYARAVAIAIKPGIGDFEAEVGDMERLVSSPGVKQMEANGFPAPLIINLAIEVAKGRKALAQSKYTQAIAHFSQAAEMQKKIPYNEPPFWYYPVNQSLGAAYFKAGKYSEAKRAFRAALFDAPNSALALYGLTQTEAKLGNRLEKKASERAFNAVWRGDSSQLDMNRI